MATTMQQVIDRARVPINDQATDAAARRYSDDDLLRYANDAVKRLVRERPDLFFGQYETLPADTLIGGNVPLDDLYVEAIVDYVVARAETRDDEEALEARAKLFFGLFDSTTGAG